MQRSVFQGFELNHNGGSLGTPALKSLLREALEPENALDGEVKHGDSRVAVTHPIPLIPHFTS